MSDEKNEQTPPGEEAEDQANEPGPEEAGAPDAETADSKSGENATVLLGDACRRN